MKNLLLVVFLVSSSYLYSQELVSTSNRWYFQNVPNKIDPELRKSEYFFADTLTNVNGREYHTLLKKTNNNIYKGSLFREENDIVYVIDNPALEERILFDFNISVGDSITIWGQSLVVAEVDSLITLSGIIRKRIKYREELGLDLDNCGSFTPGHNIVEGIGLICPSGTRSPLHWPPTTTDVNSILTCFSIDGQLEYVNENQECNLLSNSNNESTLPRLLPNPAFSTFQIEEADVVRVLIYNMNGSLVKRFEELEKRDYDIFDLTTGIYLVVINTSSSNLVVKLIKI